MSVAYLARMMRKHPEWFEINGSLGVVESRGKTPVLKEGLEG